MLIQANGIFKDPYPYRKLYRAIIVIGIPIRQRVSRKSFKKATLAENYGIQLAERFQRFCDMATIE